MVGAAPSGWGGCSGTDVSRTKHQEREIIRNEASGTKDQTMRLPRHQGVTAGSARSAPADLLRDTRSFASRDLFWTTVWLALALVAVKASYLGVPGAVTLGDGQDYLRSLAAISYVDVVFAAVIW